MNDFEDPLVKGPHVIDCRSGTTKDSRPGGGRFPILGRRSATPCDAARRPSKPHNAPRVPATPRDAWRCIENSATH